MVGVRARSRTLGRQLAELQVHTAALGTQLVSSLEARFQEVKNRAQSFRQAREVEIEEMRRGAGNSREAESTFSECAQRSTEAARQVWERSEPLRQGAKDVGEGLGARLGRAPGLVRQGRRPAANRNGANGRSRHDEERRERT